jgi:hypothetical protein
MKTGSARPEAPYTGVIMARWTRVFISYGSDDDFVTALRVQAVAASEGLDAIVPPRATRELDSAAHFDGVDVSSSFVVLAIAMYGVTDQMRWELKRAMNPEDVIILTSPEWGKDLGEQHPGKTIVLGSGRWAETEALISKVVDSTTLDEDAKRSVLGMVLMAAGVHLMAEEKIA